MARGLSALFFISFVIATATTARAQSTDERTVRLVAIVESCLDSVPATELRSAISAALGMPLFTLRDMPLQDADALITVSVTADEEVAVLVQNLGNGRRVLTVWPVPLGRGALANVADLVAMLIRGDVKEDKRQEVPSLGPMWFNPYYYGKSTSPRGEDHSPSFPPWNPYLERVDRYSVGNRT